MNILRHTIIAAALAAAMGLTAQNTSKLSPRSILKKTAPQTVLTAYINTDEGSLDREALEKLGVKITMLADGMATARIPADKLADVAATKGVEYVQTGTEVNYMLDKARAEAGADKVAQGTGLAQSYTGKGVVIGVVDAGFDYLHSDFYDANGQLRIKRVWEQSPTPTGSYHSPEKFGYGIELSTKEEIERAAGDITNNSHGTHVTGIAAGSDNFMEGAYKGVAPEADIVLVSMGATSNDNVNLTNAIAYIFDYAEAENKPCVVNLSLGNHAGPHDGTSTFDVLAGKLAGPGRLIVGSAGNHRADKFHLSRTFKGTDDEPLATFIDFKSTLSTSNVGGDIEIWGDEGTEFEVSLGAYSVFNKKESSSVTVSSAITEPQTVSISGYMSGSLTVAAERSPLNGKTHMVISSSLTNIRNNYHLSLKVIPKTAGHIDVWADNIKVGLTNNGTEGYSEPSETESTICEIGGTAPRILSVGAYTTRNEYTILGETTSRTLNEQLGAISSFSSYGPTADGRIKPEVTAPGCFIVSAVSANDASGTLIYAQANEGNGRYYMYGYMQGTSMAAPFVTGVVATWLEACPSLSPEQLKNIVKETARKDNATGTLPEMGDNSWGFGKIDAYEGLKKCMELQASGIEQTTRPFEGSVTMDGNCITIRTVPSASRIATDIYSVKGERVKGGIAHSEVVSIDISTLPTGVYILKISTDEGIRSLKFAK